MRSKEQSGNMLVRLAVSPLRALGKAKDMYVRSITNCGNNISYGDPLEGAGRFSRSRSVATAASSSSDAGDDYAELLRAASARTLVNRVDVDLALKQRQQQRASSEGLHKSSSVGMARIDEDKPYDADGGVAIVAEPYPRSRSYAVGKRKHAFETNGGDSRKFAIPTI